MPKTRAQCFDDLNNDANDIIIVTDDEDKIIEINDCGIALYGHTREVLLQWRLQDLLSPAAQAEFALHWQRAKQQGKATFKTAHRRSDNTTFPVEISVRFIEVKGKLLCHSIVSDISNRNSLSQLISKRQDLNAALLENLPSLVWYAGSDGQGEYFNRAWLNFTGRALEHQLGSGWLENIHPDDREHCLMIYQDASRARQAFVREFRLHHHAQGYRWVVDRGSPFHDLEKGLIGYIGSCHDVHEMKQDCEQMLHLGQYDALTGLPNRGLLEDRLRQAVAHARRSHGQVAVLLSDLDCFKIFNDSLGHRMGDRLLQAVAERLKTCLRESDTISRPGGDEFIIVLPGVKSIEDVAHVAEKVLRSLSDSYTIDGHELNITASMGISIYPDDGRDLETLLRNAEAAMYYAKEKRLNHYRFFTQEMNVQAFDSLMMQNHLRRALERREFQLNYQPQVDLKTGAVVGAEALIRWRHPELGLISPGQFIPIAEERGLIIPISEWVLHEACQQNRRWQGAGLPPLPVAVNLSAAHFRQENLQETVEYALQDSNLDPRLLELEITEGMVMQDAEDVVLMLNELKAMGIRLTVDDFGTGYSSLSYLKRFPLDKLKVDRSFVRDITLNEQDAEITRAIISMAHGLGLKVVAEGVETQDQLKFLRWQKCDDMQGFYFSRPLLTEDFERLVTSGRRLH